MSPKPSGIARHAGAAVLAMLITYAALLLLATSCEEAELQLHGPKLFTAIDRTENIQSCHQCIIGLLKVFKLVFNSISPLNTEKKIVPKAVNDYQGCSYCVGGIVVLAFQQCPSCCEHYSI
jgi:hypothetical protein